MRVFKTKLFGRFARKTSMGDTMLQAAIAAVQQGLVDADLGGGVLKLRIPRPGEGKSGGYRTIVLFRAGTRAVFAYDFAKNERSNIRDDELADFRKLAASILAYNDAELAIAIETGALIEVSDAQNLP